MNESQPVRRVARLRVPFKLSDSSYSPRAINRKHLLIRELRAKSNSGLLNSTMNQRRNRILRQLAVNLDLLHLTSNLKKMKNLLLFTFDKMTAGVGSAVAVDRSFRIKLLETFLIGSDSAVTPYLLTL
ncbi:hypothetical protein ALC53_05432 [Atta colombica]|uniref:Uncharacterized protein n=1 Tax=Atta colombica TaxID=520822 RepID=A0A195BJ26_9HYME|nr:hypothetical protein ALC53_05432 [Atta colombica]